MKVTDIYKPAENPIPLDLPFFTSTVAAGFPSPADDHMDSKLNLHEYLIRNSATFIVKVSGTSMIKAGIHSGDILIVDRSLIPGNEDIVIAVINGECTVKRIRYQDKRLCLVSENDRFPTFVINEFLSFEIWGVVTYVIHAL